MCEATTILRGVSKVLGSRKRPLKLSLSPTLLVLLSSPTMLARLVCALAVGSSSALQIGVPQGRRAFLSQLAAAGTLAASPLAAQAISARTGLSSPFTGEYDDKNHPGCLRSMFGMLKAHHLGSATAPWVGALGSRLCGGERRYRLRSSLGAAVSPAHGH